MNGKKQEKKLKYKIEIDSDKTLESAVFEVYLDIKKKLYVSKKPLPQSELTKVDCECDSKTKYRVL